MTVIRILKSMVSGSCVDGHSSDLRYDIS